jgi:hypothetical protein
MKHLLLSAALFSLLALPAHAAEPALACNVGALTSAERRDHEALSRKLFAAVTSRSDTATGYAFRLDRKRVSLAEVGEWIAVEERCCPFFDFRLDVGCDNGPLTLALGGREGVREFIDTELGQQKPSSQKAPSQKAPPQKASPLAGTLDTWVTRIEKEVVPAAEAMPEEKYSFAPTAGEFKGVRTFGEQVKHLAAANYQLGARILGTTPPQGEKDETAPSAVRSRTEVLDYLRGSFAYLHKAAASADESNAGFLVDALAHSSNHYGQMVEYLRMNGIVPPASR